MVEELRVVDDSIYRKRFYINLNSTPNSKVFEEIAIKYTPNIETLNPTIHIVNDTIIQVSEELFINSKKESFIDLNAPDFNEKDTFLIFSNTLFLSEEKDNKRFKFIYNDPFSSHSGSRYTYFRGGWIVRYEYGNLERYQLVYW